MSNDNKASGDQVTEYVTAMIGGQLFGLPISRVQDVFMPDRIHYCLMRASAPLPKFVIRCGTLSHELRKQKGH